MAMVKESLDINTNILDYNLENHKSNAAQQPASVQKHRRNASVNLKQLSSEQQCDLPLKANFENYENRGEGSNLSWNFFQDISYLDNQLRPTTLLSEVEPNVDNLMTRTPTNRTNSDRENFAQGVLATHAECQDQQTDPSRVSKTNGFALASASIHSVTDDIFPQPDVIFETRQIEQQQYHNFQFTSPTSTFKRRKLLQQHREHETIAINGNHTTSKILNTYNNNNNKYYEDIVEGEKCSKIYQPSSYSRSPILSNSNTVTIFANKQHQQQYIEEKEEADEEQRTTTSTGIHVKYGKQKPTHNEGATTMISNSSGVIIDHQTDKIETTTATTNSTISKGKQRGNSSINGRKPSATIGRLPDNGSTITSSDDTKPVSSNQGTTRRPNINNNSYNNNNSRHSRHRMGASLAGSRSEKSSKASGVSASGQHSFVGNMEAHMSLFGWRKKCLYGILLLLMILITTNLMLTFWILQVMEFTTEGMGLLKIVPGGIQLTGQALVMDMLRASTIRSRTGQPIAIESSRNFSINTRDGNGMLENHLFLGHDKLECLATGFRINDTAGRNLFSVNRNEVTIGAHALKIDGEGGAVFRESVQTPHIRAEPGRELRLESPTRQLEMTAAKDINLQSRAGGIELSALEDIKLSALDGSLRLESSKILMPNLRTAQSPLSGTAPNREHLHRVFQLCACANGKLFLAAPHSICAGDDSTVCR